MKKALLSNLLIFICLLQPVVFAAEQNNKDHLGCLKQIENRVHNDYLSLGYCDLTDDDMKKIATYLQQHPEIHSLDITNNFITSNGIEELKNNISLTAIYADYNNIGEDGAFILAKMSKLKELSLASNNIYDDGAVALSHLPKLYAIELSENFVMNNGAKALAANTALIHVYLNHNYIGAEGAKYFGNYPSSRLFNLQLQYNYIGDTGFIETVKLQQTNEIDAAGNHITDKSCDALQKTSATYLYDLSHNDLTDACVDKLIANDFQGYIIFDFNHLSAAGIEKLDKSKIGYSAYGNDGDGADGLNKKSLNFDEKIKQMRAKANFHKKIIDTRIALNH